MMMSQSVGDRPSGASGDTVDDGDIGLGQDPSPLARLQDAEHDCPEPGGRQHGAAGVELALAAHRRRDELEEQHHDQHDHGLADEDVAPRVGGGHPSADDRAGGHRCARHSAEDPVAQRPLRARVGLGGQRGDGGDDEDGAEALDERPADEQDRQVRRDAGDERPRAVDDKADPERPLGAPPVADLAADEHERRHDQRVQRDRGLHPDDGRVQVRRHRRDRHVHHRRVEHHDELRRSEHADDAPAGLLLERRCAVRHPRLLS